LSLMWGTGGMRRLKARERAVRGPEVPYLRMDCPLCGLRVVEGGRVSLHLLAMIGSCALSYTDEELVAMCALHQHLERAEAGLPDDAS
jgi:hypothetical protein